jgi:putative nucleotidyltransferase with HDIG domain
VQGAHERHGFDDGLAETVASLDGFPVHREARRRLALALEDDPISLDDLTAAIAADVGLALATVRVACRAPRDGDRPPAGVRAAVEELGPDGIERAAGGTAAFGPFDPHPPWGDVPERLRLHGVAAGRAAERLVRVTRPVDPDLVVTAALVHDVGKLALACAHDDYAQRVEADATPEERLAREREEFGADHARVGAALLRGWRLPEPLAAAIEHHHEPVNGNEAAALVRLADMLAHYEAGAPVDIDRMLALAEALGLGRASMGRLLYELPYPVRNADAPEPCPLSARELDAVRGLADGKGQPRIASEEGVSERALSKLLRAAYQKLGVAGRGEAVVASRERGWI